MLNKVLAVWLKLTAGWPVSLGDVSEADRWLAAQLGHVTEADCWLAGQFGPYDGSWPLVGWSVWAMWQKLTAGWLVSWAMWQKLTAGWLVSLGHVTETDCWLAGQFGPYDGSWPLVGWSVWAMWQKLTAGWLVSWAMWQKLTAGWLVSLGHVTETDCWLAGQFGSCDWSWLLINFSAVTMS